MAFYCTYQNNSGGSFDFDKDKGITHFIVVEADTSEEANSKLEDIGCYWDGCDSGQDCPCCGDRWYPVDEGDKSEEPAVYSETPMDYVKENKCLWMSPGYEIAVHYKDGRIEWY